MSHHLQQLAPDMFRMLELADDSHLRAACLRVCEYAASANGLNEANANEALDMLRQGKYFPQDLKGRLDALMDQLDDDYFQLKGQADEAGDSVDRERLTTAYRDYFGKARAVAALNYAGGQNGFDAATEAIYEAAASVANRDTVFDLVKSALSSQPRAE